MTCTVPGCAATPVGRFLQGPRCPDHTPAALAGRPEPDPQASTPATLGRREVWPYGTAKADPLGREGPGWKYPGGKRYGIPTRAKDGASGEGAPHPR